MDSVDIAAPYDHDKYAELYDALLAFFDARGIEVCMGSRFEDVKDD